MPRPAVATLALALLGASTRGLVGLQVESPETLEVTWDSEDDTMSIDMPEAEAMSKARARVGLGSTLSFSNGTGCLTFVHIPKTGGTFVESKKSSGVYDHAPWGVHDKQLNCNGHGAKCPAPCQGCKSCCPMKDGSACSLWHVPPHLDPELERSYGHGGCETFCVVREPASRFRSQHAWSSLYDKSIRQPACSTESLDEAVDKKLAQVEKTPYMDDCHLVPQAVYYNHGLGCKNVIKHENFEKEFPKLLSRFGINRVKVQERVQKLSTNCHASFSRKSLEKIHEYYSQDYDSFGYPKILPAE